MFTMPLLSADADWDRLKSLRTGERIWIDYSTAGKRRSAKAEAVAWTAQDLSVRFGKTEVTLARSDVRKVSVYGGKSRKRGAGMGALIGGGIGAGLYGGLSLALGNDSDYPTGWLVAAGTLLFAGIGALVGVGIGSEKKVVIYQVQ
jgi:hypothetical protein